MGWSGDVHKGVRKADFGTVDGAIARRFDEGEVFGIRGVEEGCGEVSLEGCDIHVLELQEKEIELGASTMGRPGLDGPGYEYREGKGCC